MPCSPRSPLGQRGAKLRCLGKLQGRGGSKLGAGAPVPRSPLHLHAQVYRAKLEGDSAALPPRMKSSTPSSSQLNISALGRSPSPKVGLQGGSRALWGAAA